MTGHEIFFAVMALLAFAALVWPFVAMALVMSPPDRR